MLVFKATQVTDEILAALKILIPQLMANHSPPTREELTALVESDSSTLLLARHPDERAPIVGALTLVLYRVPTGVRARIEDVIVDSSMRGQGIGEALVGKALALAHQAGADGVALNSNPRREAANRLYQRMGFERWKTNLYVYKF